MDRGLVNGSDGEKPQENGFQWYGDSVKWRVTSQNLESGQRTSEDFYAVLVCNGYNYYLYIHPINYVAYLGSPLTILNFYQF